MALSERFSAACPPPPPPHHPLLPRRRSRRQRDRPHHRPHHPPHHPHRPLLHSPTTILSAPMRRTATAWTTLVRRATARIAGCSTRHYSRSLGSPAASVCLTRGAARDICAACWPAAGRR